MSKDTKYDIKGHKEKLDSGVRRVPTSRRLGLAERVTHNAAEFYYIERDKVKDNYKDKSALRDQDILSKAVEGHIKFVVDGIVKDNPASRVHLTRHSEELGFKLAQHLLKDPTGRDRVGNIVPQGVDISKLTRIVTMFVDEKEKTKANPDAIKGAAGGGEHHKHGSVSLANTNTTYWRGNANHLRSGGGDQGGASLKDIAEKLKREREGRARRKEERHKYDGSHVAKHAHGRGHTDGVGGR